VQSPIAADSLRVHSGAKGSRPSISFICQRTQLAWAAKFIWHCNKLFKHNNNNNKIHHQPKQTTGQLEGLQVGSNLAATWPQPQKRNQARHKRQWAAVVVQSQSID